MSEFVTLEQHLRLEDTVQQVVNTVGKLSEAQVATTASINSLTDIVKAETQNRQAQDEKTEQILRELATDVRATTPGISVKQMLTALAVAIGMVGTVVAIIGAIGTLGVWIATNISTNVAASLDDRAKNSIVELQKEDVLFRERAKHLDYRIYEMYDSIESLKEKAINVAVLDQRIKSLESQP